jgi:hypothetical protein
MKLIQYNAPFDMLTHDFAGPRAMRDSTGLARFGD